MKQVPKIYYIDPVDPRITVGKDKWFINSTDWKNLGCSKLDLMCDVAFAQSPNSETECVLSSVYWGGGGVDL